MGALLALAGAATIPGCRRPDHKIMSYSQQVPEEIIPGKPLFYATSMPLPGGGGGPPGRDARRPPDQGRGQPPPPYQPRAFVDLGPGVDPFAL